MENDKFEWYITESMANFNPDIDHVIGKHITIREKIAHDFIVNNLMAQLRLLGFILYPGLTNTTTITQETDASNGSIKTSFEHNLEFTTIMN